MEPDEDLIIRSRKDPEAFRALFDRWSEPLLAYFYRRTFDAEVSADLLAETFAVAFERRHRFRRRGRPGATWLYGIASRELSHWYRRQEVEHRATARIGLEVPELDDESIARIEALDEVSTYRESLTQSLSRLSEAEREAVELRVVDELGYPEIAARLTCSESAARQRVHRGLRHLNQLLAKEASL